METPIITIGPDDKETSELESEMTSVDVASSEAGILRHLKREGDPVRSGELIARIDPLPNRQ